MTLRLEKLGLIPKGSSENLKESHFSPMKAAHLLDLSPQPETSQPYPQRYKFLAVRAIDQGKITQVQLARFLRCDIVTARQIITECITSTDISADGSRATLDLEQEFERSLLPQVS